MKFCPYCNNPVDNNSAYCPKCNKPLITNLFQRRYREINDFIQDDFLDLNVNSNPDIDNQIAQINKKIEEKQLSGGDFGSLLLEKAGLYYQKRELQESLKILKIAQNYFLEERNSAKIAVIYNEIGLIHEENGFYDDAIYHFEQAIEIFKNINEYQKLILVYNNLANIYYLLKNIEQSYKIYDKALEIAKKENFVLEEIKTSSNIVDVLFVLKQYDRIEKILKRNIDYFNEIGDLYGIIVSNIKLAILFYHQNPNNYQKSLESLNNTLKLIDNSGESISISIKAQLIWECLFYLGKIFLKAGEYNKAEGYLIESLNQLRIFEINESLSEVKILNKLGKLYSLKEDFINSIEYYKLSSEIYYKFGDDFKLAQIKIKIANIFNENLNNDSKAIEYYEQALEICYNSNYIKQAADILHNLGDLYLNKGIIDLTISNWTEAKDIYENIQDEYNFNLLTEKIRSISDTNSNNQ